MRLIRPINKAGWLALGVRNDCVMVTHVRRRADRLPEVLRCESFQKEGSDEDALARLSRSLHLSRYRCTTALAFGEYQMLQMEPPPVPAAEIKAALRWRLKAMIDYPVEEATLDVLEIPADQATTSRNRSLFAVCAPNRVIERYVRLFQSAAIPLTVIDIPETCQRNLAALFEPVGRGVAMVAFHNDGGLLTFSFGGELYFARRIDITLTQMVEADDEGRFQLFERIQLELQRSLDNFEHQFHFINIARLLVAPLPESIRLTEFLASNLYLPVETIDLASVLDISAVPDLREPERQARYLTLIGAALRDQEGGGP